MAAQLLGNGGKIEPYTRIIMDYRLSKYYLSMFHAAAVPLSIPSSSISNYICDFLNSEFLSPVESLKSVFMFELSHKPL
jgi:hypothetical protein